MSKILIPIFGMLAIVIILILVIKIIELSKKVKNIENNEKDTEKNGIKNNYPYHQKYLLSSNEYKFYKNLKPITDKYNLQILPKVRIWDIIDVNKGLNNSERTSAENRIKPRHFDFVLTDNDLYIKCIIELDDNSHNNEKSKSTDEFKNKLCEMVNLPIIRCYNINGVENQICEKLNINKKSP